MITQIEPVILEYEVKWALGSITTNKASGGDGIPAELFKILKDDALKVLRQKIWKTQQWWQDWKRSVFIPIPKKGNVKECSNCRATALISQASKIMLKILQARFQQYVNWESPDVQYKLDLEKLKEPEFKLPTSTGSLKKRKQNKTTKKNTSEFQKKSTSASLTMLKTLCQSQKTWKFFKRWEYQTTWPASWETCMQDKKQQLVLDMEQWTGSKSGKEYVKAVYCHPAYLTYAECVLVC